MTCPHCGNWHEDGTQFCPQTGKPIAQEPSGAPADGPSAMSPSFAGQAASAEPKGVGVLLQEAVELYSKHFVALVITCGIVLIPVGLMAGGLAAVITPSGGEVANLQARSERMQERAKEMRDLQRTMHDGSPEEQDAARKRIQTLGRESARDAAAVTAAAGGMLARFAAFLLLAILLIPLQIIGTFLAQAALIPIVGDRALGGSMQWQQAWALVAKRIVPIVITSILAGLAVGLGLIACVVPGLVLGFLFALSTPVVMLEGKSGVDALKRSAALVKAHWVNVLIVLIVYALVIGISSAIVTAIFHGFLGIALARVVAAVLFPLPTLALVLLYLDLRRVDEGVTEGELHQKMTGQLS
jgi:hypothetical protein